MNPDIIKSKVAPGGMLLPIANADKILSLEYFTASKSALCPYVGEEVPLTTATPLHFAVAKLLVVLASDCGALELTLS